MTSLVVPILEGLLALALAGVAIMCWRMDRRLDALRNGRDEAISSAAALLDAVTRAETAVRGLRATSSDVGTELQARIDEARTLSAELEAHSKGPPVQLHTPAHTPLPRSVSNEAPHNDRQDRAKRSARPAPNWADLR